MQEKLAYQRKMQRKLYKEVAETIHQARLKRASKIERLILKHINRKHKLKDTDK